MMRVYLFLALFSVVGGSLYGAYAYYKDSQARIQLLTANNATLKAADERNQAAINDLKDAAALQAQLTQDLMKNLQKSEQYSDDLRKKLSSHDLTYLSIRKPGLIESRINNGTKKLFESLESDTAK